jgi:Uma2 family endonuclease
MEARSFEPDALAPWAEIVPNVPPMTIEEFLEYSDEDGWHYELVEGILVRMVGSRPRAIRITMRLLDALSPYVRSHALGQVTPPDVVYDFEHTGQKDTGLLPDVGFYAAAREPMVDPDKPYPFAPDLAVEIASPKQYRPAMAAKARRYLAGGTGLVWVLWPGRQQVGVWRPGDVLPSQTLGPGDMLIGDPVVPGFTFPVADLFR